MTRSSSPFRRQAIRFSRTIGLTRAIAIGCSITVVLGVFVLADLLLGRSASLVGLVYLSFGLLAAPIVLFYAERAAVLPGGGPYALVRINGALLRVYAVGWLLLGTYLGLLALLSWGAALYAAGLTQWLFGLVIDSRWLAPGLLLFIVLNNLSGARGGWRLRMLTIYGAIGMLLILLLRSWLNTGLPTLIPAEPGTTRSFLSDVALLTPLLGGILLLLERRDEMRTPERLLLPALFVPLLIGLGLGALLSATALQSPMPSLIAATAVDLTIIARSSGTPLLEIIAFGFGMALCMIALNRLLVSLIRLTGAMIRDGFFPLHVFGSASDMTSSLVLVRFIAVLAAFVVLLLPMSILAAFVAGQLLGMTMLLSVPDVAQPAPRLPRPRRLSLPLHPLFPVLVTLIAGTLMLVLPWPGLLIGAGWLLGGALVYAGYARNGSTAVRRRETVLSDSAPEQRAVNAYTVLAGIANPETAGAIIRAGAALARARQGRLLVLSVATFPDQMPLHIQQQQAQTRLQALNRCIADAQPADVDVEGLVRLAQNPVEGLLATVREERAQRLVLGWHNDRISERGDLDPLLDPVVRNAACEVIILRGDLPAYSRHVLVPLVHSRNSAAALRLARELAGSDDGCVTALHLVQEVFSPTTMDEQHERLQKLIDSVGGDTPVMLRLDATDDVQEQILREAEGQDLLVLGASRGGVLDQTVFGGTPVAVARRARQPTLMVKHTEGASQFWSRRAWELISSPFPQIAHSERINIYQQVRQTAEPGIDFFIMIGLSAMIAVLGLLLGSPAVIIGAMLVAPLMSPILAMSMSIVHGNLHLLRKAAVTTSLGILLAISMAAGITLLMPTLITTEEILARTQPNLLDLLVALASGTAGGYAIARKEVAAALPGVAIAAALVPPLGVVGYGMATAQVTIAGGALLLFTTNLIAIIIAAAVVFLLLGFRPEQSRVRPLVRLKFGLSLLSLILIAVPLGTLTAASVQQINRQNQISAQLQSLESADTRITDMQISREDEQYRVRMTIHTLEPERIDAARIDELEDHVSRRLGVDLRIDATVLPALLLPARPAAPATPGAVP
jgi:uncharacterized hydrophobic protein (TIGR00271 family)